MYMKSLILCVLTVFFPKLATQTTDDVIDCNYRGDMCKVDVEDCLKKKLYDGDMTDCFGIAYQDLFTSRDDVEFWIDIYDRRNYAQNLTYIIISEIQETWKSVSNCCRMDPTSTCMLPKRKKNERFFIYLPMKNPGQYCELQLFEYEEELKWCSETHITPCKEIDRGIITIKGLYHPLSTDFYHPPADFCFFYAPSEFVQTRNGSLREFSNDVKGIKHVESNNSVLVGTTQKKCDLMENISAKNITEHISSRYKRSADETVCFFTRLKGYDNKWDTSPICQTPCTIDEDCYVDGHNAKIMWKSIFATLSISVSLLIIVLFIWKCRKSIATCTPTLEDSIKELPNSFVSRNKDDCEFVDVVHFERFHAEPINELPKEIKYKDSKFNKDEKDEVDRYISTPAHGQLSISFEEKVDAIIKPNKTVADVYKTFEAENYENVPDILESDVLIRKQQHDGLESEFVEFQKSQSRKEKDANNTDSGFSDSSKRSSSDCENISLSYLNCVANEQSYYNVNPDQYDVDSVSAKKIYQMNYPSEYDYIEKSFLMSSPQVKIQYVDNDLISRQKRISSSSSGCVSADTENRGTHASLEENTESNAVLRFDSDTLYRNDTCKQSCLLPGCYVKK